MDNVSYVTLSRQMSIRSMMDVTANNMANMNTPGYKAQNMLFSEELSQKQGNGERISQVKNHGSYRDLSQGSLTQTSNKFDFALQGDGYFAVQTPEGIRYTRAGSFSLNAQGEIVDKMGNQVLGENGRPLTVQAGATQVTTTVNGTLSSEKGSIGKLKVVTFEDTQGVSPVGDNLMIADDNAEIPVDSPKVIQGMLENSNVQPILEMNRMTELLRMYQSVQNIVNNEHDMLRSMIQHMTRV